MKALKIILSLTVAILDITLTIMMIKSLSEDDDLSEYKKSSD